MKTNLSKRICEHCNKPYVIQEFKVLDGTKQISVANCDCQIKLEEKKAMEQEIMKRKDKINRLFSISSLGSKFQKRRFETWKQRKGTEKIFVVCKSFTDNFIKGKGIFLTGEKGNGKTHLAASIANKLNDKFIPSIFLNMSDFYTKIEHTYSNNTQTTQFEILETIKLADLVVLNDLGKEKWTSKRIDTLFSLVEMLYNHEISTIITINPKALKEMEKSTQKDLSEKDKETLEAIIDRLKEICAGNILVNRASSFREHLAQTSPPL